MTHDCRTPEEEPGAKQEGGTMIDSFGREVDYLRISVTDRCNYRCLYCMPPEGVPKRDHSEMLSLEEIAEVVRAAAGLGIRKIRLTGGEPLVRRGLPSLVREISATPGIEEITMTTNGSLLAPMAKELKEAGLQRVNVSLDTLDADKFARVTRLGSARDVWRGIHAAIAWGLTPLKLNVVLIGGFNDDEIPELAALARSHPVEVRFIELMPMLSGSGFGREAYLPCSAVLEKVPELVPDRADTVARLYRFPDGQGRVGLISPLSHQFCPGCNRLRLTADGCLKPCLHSSEEIPLKGLHGEALEQAIRRAVDHKPQQHGALSCEELSQAGRQMNQIGG